MGGVACNGWCFWSLTEGGEAEAKAAKPKRARKAEKAQAKRQVVHRMENQEGLPGGHVRYFCNACLDTFIGEGDQEPEACPAGHKAEDPEVAKWETPLSEEERSGRHSIRAGDRRGSGGQPASGHPAAQLWSHGSQASLQG